tara:strand:- start:111 stop:371 length:261 start_codon:yes stop_codon:yes gene_type:complete
MKTKKDDFLYDKNALKVHKVRRDLIKWGSYGKLGGESQKVNTLATLADSHLFNIYMTQGHLDKDFKDILFTEMFYRLYESGVNVKG